jgi:hypothetical protein
LLSWVHVLEWRAVTPEAVALTDDRGGEPAVLPLRPAGSGHLTAPGRPAERLRGPEPLILLHRPVLREPFWAGRERRVS